MSGGYFNRHMIAFGEIANSIERDIARTLQPKPGRYIKIIGPVSYTHLTLPTN